MMLATDMPIKYEFATNYTVWSGHKNPEAASFSDTASGKRNIRIVV